MQPSQKRRGRPFSVSRAGPVRRPCVQGARRRGAGSRHVGEGPARGHPECARWTEPKQRVARVPLGWHQCAGGVKGPVCLQSWGGWVNACLALLQGPGSDALGAVLALPRLETLQAVDAADGPAPRAPPSAMLPPTAAVAAHSGRENSAGGPLSADIAGCIWKNFTVAAGPRAGPPGLAQQHVFAPLPLRREHDPEMHDGATASGPDLGPRDRSRQVAELAAMGFSREAAKAALAVSGDSMEAAVGWLLDPANWDWLAQCASAGVSSCTWPCHISPCSPTLLSFFIFLSLVSEICHQRRLGSSAPASQLHPSTTGTRCFPSLTDPGLLPTRRSRARGPPQSSPRPLLQRALLQQRRIQRPLLPPPRLHAMHSSLGAARAAAPVEPSALWTSLRRSPPAPPLAVPTRLRAAGRPTPAEQPRRPTSRRCPGRRRPESTAASARLCAPATSIPCRATARPTRMRWHPHGKSSSRRSRPAAGRGRGSSRSRPRPRRRQLQSLRHAAPSLRHGRYGLLSPGLWPGVWLPSSPPGQAVWPLLPLAPVLLLP